MPQVTKPVALYIEDGNPNRLSKEELRMREEYEKSLLTGQRAQMSESVKKNPIARKIFNRTIKLLDKIEKSDALYENSINRYCLLLAEQEELVERKSKLEENLESLFAGLEQAVESGDLELVAQIGNSADTLQKTINAIDRSLNTKRNQSLAIEKENIMTIASALRAIPKRAKDMPPEDKQTPFMRIFGGQLNNDNKNTR